MPRSNISTTVTGRVSSTAPTPAASDSVNGNSTPNDGHTILVCKNTDTSSHTVTVNIQRQVDGVVPAAKVFTVAAGATVYLGPWNTLDYGTTLQYQTNSALVTVLPLVHGSA